MCFGLKQLIGWYKSGWKSRDGLAKHMCSVAQTLLGNATKGCLKYPGLITQMSMETETNCRECEFLEKLDFGAMAIVLGIKYFLTKGLWKFGQLEQCWNSDTMQIEICSANLPTSVFLINKTSETDEPF